MATLPTVPSAAGRRVRSPLTDCLIALAGTPDDSSWIDTQLIAIAQLAADLVAPVSYASITAHRDGAYTTLAASSDIALAVDEAQYADDRGPCLDAIDGGSPAAVRHIPSAMAWPGFRDEAYVLGLRASVSVPLFAGHGTPVAALNLYGRDSATMSPLADAVWAVFESRGPAGVHNPAVAGPAVMSPALPHPACLDPGGAALLAGLAGALGVRDMIQQAIGIILSEQHRTPDIAYLTLRLRAAETGLTLADTATAVITENLYAPPDLGE